MERMEVIQKRLNTSEAEVLAHIITCELDDIEEGVMLFADEDEVETKISLLIANEDILEEEHINLTDAIIKEVEDDVLCEEEGSVNEIVERVINNRKNVFINWKKSWRDEADRLSPIPQVRERVKITDEIRSVKIQATIDNIMGTVNWLQVSIKLDTLEKELKRVDEELAGIGLQILF